VEPPHRTPRVPAHALDVLAAECGEVRQNGFLVAFSAHVTSHLQLIQRDGQVADALAGGVIDRVRDRGRDADDADFSEPF
jgi:hypothetical protein